MAFFLLCFPALCSERVVDSVEFKYGKNSYMVEVRLGERAKVSRPRETSCWNPNKSPEVEGSCHIVLVKEGEEVSKVSFENCLFVKRGVKWETPVEPLKVFVNGERPPVVLFTQYGTCATNVKMVLLWLDPKNIELKPVVLTSFHGKWEGEIYARNVEVVGREIWIGIYDQSVGMSYLQFSEVEDGVYSLIGYYTQAGGSFSVAEDILRRKRKKKLY